MPIFRQIYGGIGGQAYINTKGKRDIELFARNNYVGWDNWGLEIPDSKIEISTGLVNKNEEESGQLKLDV